MKRQHDPLRNTISQKISEAHHTAFGGALSAAEIYDQLVEPPNKEMGDLAFPCFTLAKQQKKAPPQIAAELAQKIVASDFSFQAAGPYINFNFKPEFVGAQLLNSILNEQYFKTRLTENAPKTMIEYSQPNTHKELHVGHMRNACLGDAVIRLHRYAGYEIIGSTFPGDVGTHVAKCLWYLKFHNQEAVPATNKGEWLGRIYSKAHLKLEDELGTPQEEKNREQLTLILKQLESGHGEYFDLWKETRQWSIDLMNSIYKWADIHFDRWYWESDVDADSVKYVKSLYEKNLLVKSEGAIGMNLEEDNLGFCLLLKSDGTGLYATKDLELARRKFQDFKIEKNVYVVDMRQALHFKQVFKVLEKIGFEQARQCFHLQYNFVELPDGAMSSRKGNIVPLIELVHKMEEMVKTNYLARYKDEWSAEEVQQTAEIVAKGAIKYGMLRIDTNKKIVFDMNEWLKIDGESGPFIQYSYARIQSLIRKTSVKSGEPQWQLLTHSSERGLLQQLMHFNSIVLNSAENYKPAQLCTYLYELAKRFNLFYHDCSIGQADSEELKLARLRLSQAVGIVLKQGLALLGIPAPDKM